MARKSGTRYLAETSLGQHLALPVAAHLARTQLVSDPLSVCDGQHLSEMLDVMARALAKVAPLYAQDPGSGQPRELNAAELEGASVRRGATVVMLRDGRTLSSVTIKRADLRQAIAVLKAVGVEELLPQPKKAAEPAPPAPDRVRDALAQLTELEALLQPPLVTTRIDQASRLAVSIARHAPHGRVANLAMQLMSALHEARGAGEIPASLGLVSSRLRAALDETTRPA
jgi:hypothetical protein